MEFGKQVGLKLSMASIVSLKGFNLVIITTKTPYLNLSKQSCEVV